MKRICLAVLCAASLLAACKPAASTPTFKATATTQDIMGGVMDPTAQLIWQSVRVEVDLKGTHETKPETKEAWQKIGFAARGLADMSSMLLYEGHLEDHGEWEKFTKEMAEKSMAVAKAADDQDAEAIISTGGELYDACTKCHMVYLDKVMARRTGGTAPASPSAAPGAPPPTK